jgi:hypothetical protein
MVGQGQSNSEKSAQRILKVADQILRAGREQSAADDQGVAYAASQHPVCSHLRSRLDQHQTCDSKMTWSAQTAALKNQTLRDETQRASSHPSPFSPPFWASLWNRPNPDQSWLDCKNP